MVYYISHCLLTLWTGNVILSRMAILKLSVTITSKSIQHVKKQLKKNLSSGNVSLDQAEVAVSIEIETIPSCII